LRRQFGANRTAGYDKRAVPFTSRGRKSNNTGQREWRSIKLALGNDEPRIFPILKDSGTGNKFCAINLGNQHRSTSDSKEKIRLERFRNLGNLNEAITFWIRRNPAFPMHNAVECIQSGLHICTSAILVDAAKSECDQNSAQGFHEFGKMLTDGVFAKADLGGVRPESLHFLISCASISTSQFFRRCVQILNGPLVQKTVDRATLENSVDRLIDMNWVVSALKRSLNFFPCCSESLFNR
jgi:hypothetical protein